MGKARIAADAGAAAVRTALDSWAEAGAGAEAATGAGVGAGARVEAAPGASRDVVALSVRYLLQVVGEAAPGKTLEVRVPPFGAVQCVDGPAHTRGTPPNVIEMDATTWLQLATGALEWADAVTSGAASASGSRANLDGLLPLKWKSDRMES